jgi:hypothetical protein
MNMSHPANYDKDSNNLRNSPIPYNLVARTRFPLWNESHPNMSTPKNLSYERAERQRPRLSSSALASFAKHMKEAEAFASGIRLLRTGNPNQQSQSLLFGRLPIEIRTLIWAEVVKAESGCGLNTIWIAWIRGRLMRVGQSALIIGAHVPELPWLAIPHPCPYRHDSGKWIGYYNSDFKTSEILFLLLSCRKMYDPLVFGGVRYNI